MASAFARCTWSRWASVVALAGLASSAQAFDFRNIYQLADQSQFKTITEDLSATLSYKSLNPSKSLGILGFDVSVFAGATSIQSSATLYQATAGKMDVSMLPYAGVHVAKGLPFGIDVEGQVVSIVGSSAMSWSVAAKKALIDGGLVAPAISLRTFYTKASGLDTLSLSSYGGDLSISKTFLMFTPYAGVGVVRTSASDSSGTWADVNYWHIKKFVGVNTNLLLMDINLEANTIGQNTSGSIKAGFKF